MENKFSRNENSIKKYIDNMQTKIKDYSKTIAIAGIAILAINGTQLIANQDFSIKQKTINEKTIEDKFTTRVVLNKTLEIIDNSNFSDIESIEALLKLNKNIEFQNNGSKTKIEPLFTEKEIDFLNETLQSSKELSSTIKKIEHTPLDEVNLKNLEELKITVDNNLYFSKKHIKNACNNLEHNIYSKRINIEDEFGKFTNNFSIDSIDKLISLNKLNDKDDKILTPLQIEKLLIIKNQIKFINTFIDKDTPKHSLYLEEFDKSCKKMTYELSDNYNNFIYNKSIADPIRTKHITLEESINYDTNSLYNIKSINNIIEAYTYNSELNIGVNILTPNEFSKIKDMHQILKEKEVFGNIIDKINTFYSLETPNEKDTLIRSNASNHFNELEDKYYKYIEDNGIEDMIKNRFKNPIEEKELNQKQIQEGGIDQELDF